MNRKKPKSLPEMQRSVEKTIKGLQAFIEQVKAYNQTESGINCPVEFGNELAAITCMKKHLGELKRVEKEGGLIEKKYVERAKLLMKDSIDFNAGIEKNVE